MSGTSVAKRTVSAEKARFRFRCTLASCCRKDVLTFTTKFFNLLEAKAHDATYGGYISPFPLR